MTTTRSNLGSFLVWFAMLGGAVAWLLHFLLAYLLAEFGCQTVLRERAVLGITGVSWAVLLVTVVMLAVAVAALAAAHYNQRVIADHMPGARANLHFAAHLGRISNALFAFIIVFETIPIFFYLGGC